MCWHFATQFDSNGDGQISLSELREAMKKLLGEQLTPRDIDAIIRDGDLNGDGQVDFEGQEKIRQEKGQNIVLKIDIQFITDSRIATAVQTPPWRKSSTKIRIEIYK